MTQPIFAKPRHEYHSYRDFWTLVKLCGYSTCFIDEMDTGNAGQVYIFTGPDVSNEFKGAKARIIYWLLEWYGDYYQRPGVAETWVSNVNYAEMIGAKFVPMGGHPGLGTTTGGGGEYDIVHMSYDGIHRRSLMLNSIRDLGVSIAPNGWFGERDYSLRNSSAMLHIHQNVDFPGIAPLRAVLAAAYALPLIAEDGWESDPYTDYTNIAEYRYLPRMVLQTLSVKNLNERGLAFNQYVCETIRFDKMVEAAL